jgi:16S rRNA (uracil1498-N3)-methyltransferase
MALHRIHLDDPDLLTPLPGELTIAGDEAHHAIRVKRLGAGDFVEVLDGRGGVGAARIRATEKVRGQWRLVLEVAEVRRVPPVSPAIDVLSPPPKGPRLAELIDGLAQAGAASWSPLATEFGSGEPGNAKADRVHRCAAEASKQSGRAWALRIGEARGLQEVMAGGVTGATGGRVVLADPSGHAYERTGAERITLLIGPEGGWSARELDVARKAGLVIARFGPHVMRVETAAVAAVAVILDSESRSENAPGR